MGVVFDRSITNVLNMGLDVYNCIVCVFMLVSIASSVRKNKGSFYFALLSITVMIFCIADMSNWCCEGLTPSWKVPALHILTFIFYFIVPFQFLLLIKYIEEYLKPKKISPAFFTIALVVTVIYVLLVCITPVTGLIYKITPDNYYARGDYNFISALLNGIMYLIVLIIIIVYRKSFATKEIVIFLVFTVLPIFAEAIQLLVYGMNLVTTAMCVSILLIFMNLYTNLEMSLEMQVDEIHKQEEKMIMFQDHVIISLSNLVENRDTQTAEHARRTSLFVGLLATKTMNDGYFPEILSEKYIKNLIKAAPMHDIGKIVVSDTILKKPGRLTPEEFEAMKVHTSEGGRIVSDIIGLSDDIQYTQIAVEVAQGHHERWDGTGYPSRLKGDKIPLSARIMAIADVFDALVFERCYKEPFPPDQAFEIIQSEAGTHFDPVLAKEFLQLKDEILRIVDAYQR